MPKVGHIAKDKPVKKKAVIQQAPTYYQYRTGSCYSKDDNVNCHVKSVLTHIKQLDERIVDTLNGWGGCCGQ
jgi:hypothetical protein